MDGRSSRGGSRGGGWGRPHSKVCLPRLSPKRSSPRRYFNRSICYCIIRIASVCQAVSHLLTWPHGPSIAPAAPSPRSVIPRTVRSSERLTTRSMASMSKKTCAGKQIRERRMLNMHALTMPATSFRPMPSSSPRTSIRRVRKS